MHIHIVVHIVASVSVTSHNIYQCFTIWNIYLLCRSPKHLVTSIDLWRVADNCDFYPAYPGFDYFAGVHHGAAADFLTPPHPPPPPPVSSGPHHVGPPQPPPLGDHVAPRKLPSQFAPRCC